VAFRPYSKAWAVYRHVRNYLYRERSGKPVVRSKVNDPELIKDVDAPVTLAPTIAILTGNLAPAGAVIKAAAASPHLLRHSGKAVVFDHYDDMLSRIDDPDLPVDENSVLVLRNSGPTGVPGMPEWGAIPVPKKLRTKRNRGYGTDKRCPYERNFFWNGGAACSTRIGPWRTIGFGSGWRLYHAGCGQEETAIGNKRGELKRRTEAWQPPQSKHTRGYPKLYIGEVLQADEGCDFRFLKTRKGG
jgi:dihydroxy-acid dehydratase